MGVRSEPPPNQLFVVTRKRVFICTAGTFGDCICATRDMPEAQKRPSSAAPGICLRNSGENSPWTVEMFTPTFSKTRPRMMLITPPPPPGRSQALRSKRPAGRLLRGPVSSSSSCSKAAQMRSRRVWNQLPARAFRSSIRVSLIFLSFLGTVWFRKRVQLAQGFPQNHCRRSRDIDGTQARLDRNDEAGAGSGMDMLRSAFALAAEQQDVVFGKPEGRVGDRRPGGQQDQPARRAFGGKAVPAFMTMDFGVLQIVQGAAPDRLNGKGEAAGLDDVDRDVQAGTETQDGAQVGRYVGLEQGDPHRSIRRGRGRGDFLRFINVIPRPRPLRQPVACFGQSAGLPQDIVRNIRSRFQDLIL